MTLAGKLKSIRKQAGMSQEQLAEKLGVSRQAVTKWETDAGIPDIENVMAISALFNISIDDLLSNEKAAKQSTDYLFESITEYDVDESKRFDMKFGGQSSLCYRAVRVRKSVFVLHRILFPRFRMILRSKLMILEKELMWM